MVKDMICTVCPRGCRIKVEGLGENITDISGFSCKRGEKYGRQEFIRPLRILTSSVKVEGRDDGLLPVRSDGPVPLMLMGECMEIIRNTSVNMPLKRYDVIIEDICNTGCNIVATGELL